MKTLRNDTYIITQASPWLPHQWKIRTPTYFFSGRNTDIVQRTTVATDVHDLVASACLNSVTDGTRQFVKN